MKLYNLQKHERKLGIFILTYLIVVWIFSLNTNFFYIHLGVLFLPVLILITVCFLLLLLLGFFILISEVIENLHSKKWFWHTHNAEGPAWFPITWQGWIITAAYFVGFPVVTYFVYQFFTWMLASLFNIHLNDGTGIFLAVTIFLLYTSLYLYIANKKSE